MGFYSSLGQSPHVSPISKSSFSLERGSLITSHVIREYYVAALILLVRGEFHFVEFVDGFGNRLRFELVKRETKSGKSIGLFSF